MGLSTKNLGEARVWRTMDQVNLRMHHHNNVSSANEWETSEHVPTLLRALTGWSTLVILIHTTCRYSFTADWVYSSGAKNKWNHAKERMTRNPPLFLCRLLFIFSTRCSEKYTHTQDYNHGLQHGSRTMYKCHKIKFHIHRRITKHNEHKQPGQVPRTTLSLGPIKKRTH